MKISRFISELGRGGLRLLASSPSYSPRIPLVFPYLMLTPPIFLPCRPAALISWSPRRKASTGTNR